MRAAIRVPTISSSAPPLLKPGAPESICHALDRPIRKDPDSAALEKRLWDAADQFRANSGLKSQEYSAPVLGLIFLPFAGIRFAAQRADLKTGYDVSGQIHHPLTHDFRH